MSTSTLLSDIGNTQHSTCTARAGGSDNAAKTLLKKRSLETDVDVIVNTSTTPTISASIVNTNETTPQSGSSDNDDDNDSVASTKQNHGTWKDDPTDSPWHGCVCGEIHGRPIKVFWIQCEGPCNAWFNVQSQCVDGLTAQTAETCEWYCASCRSLTEKQSAPLRALLELPQDVMYRILEFVAKPTYRAGVLQHQLAPLSKTARHFVQGDGSRGLWDSILRREYQKKKQQQQQKGSAKISAAAVKQIKPPSPTRASKRRRKKTNFLSHIGTSNDHPRHSVEQHHLALLDRTEDAYHVIEELADPLQAYNRQRTKGSSSSSPPKSIHSASFLTLSRLRPVLNRNCPIDVDRPSPCTGRTLLQVVCAGEMAEGVIVSCARHLLQDHGADPNAMSRNEYPYADRPALYFAIARAMPNLVQTLVDAGASLSTKVQGKFKMTFDTNRDVEGEYTPLEYALLMKRVEVIETAGRGEGSRVPPYWVAKLNTMIRQLTVATEDEERRRRLREKEHQKWNNAPRQAANQTIAATTTTTTSTRGKRAANRKKR